MIDPSLQASYRECHRLAKRSGSSFYRSFSLLRPERRSAMFALYAFARIIDDIADETDEGSIASAMITREQLFQWIDDIENEIHTDSGNQHSSATMHSSAIPFGSRSPLVKIRPAMIDASRRYRIPMERYREMVRGVTIDRQSKSLRFQTEKELDDYCYLVASSVGLACLSIWGADVDNTRRAAVDCGIAFQLTNILRDVREDTLRDRIYLPQDSFIALRIDPAAWIRCEPDGRWRDLIKSEADRAMQLYASGHRVIEALDTDSSKMFSLMWVTYRALLDKVVTDIDSIWHRRVRLSYFTKANLYLQHALTPLYCRTATTAQSIPTTNNINAVNIKQRVETDRS